MTRTCKLCSATEKTTDFYSGVSSRCKECHKAAVIKNRAAKADYYRQYDKMRFQRDPWRRQANKEYAQTDRGKEVAAKARRKFLDMCPEKRAAHIILGNAVRSGRVVKPKQCSRCHSTPKSRDLHGHHYDYAKPLEVEWVCVACHAREHFGPPPEPRFTARSKAIHVKGSE